MSEACRVIVEASRRYATSIEGLAWDNVLDAAPLLQAYVLGGHEAANSEKSRKELQWQIARMLWAILSVWGHLWEFGCWEQDKYSGKRREVCVYTRWRLKSTEFVSVLLNELREPLERVASLPEVPSIDDIRTVSDDLKTLIRAVDRHIPYVGFIGAAKMISVLTLFHVPPVDTKIARVLLGTDRLSEDTYTYLTLIEALTRLLNNCMRDRHFALYLAERRAHARSVVRGKPFKVLDEGLWFIAQRDYWKNEEERRRVYEEIRRLAGLA